MDTKPLLPCPKPTRDPKPHRRLNKRNEDRLAKRREEEFAISSGYRDWVVSQPCAACGSYDREVGSDPAHVGKTRGAGAKADAVLSLCRECHVWEGERRNEFNHAFQARHRVWPWEMALARYEAFHRDR